MKRKNITQIFHLHFASPVEKPKKKKRAKQFAYIDCSTPLFVGDTENGKTDEGAEAEAKAEAFTSAQGAGGNKKSTHGKSALTPAKLSCDFEEDVPQ